MLVGPDERRRFGRRGGRASRARRPGPGGRRPPSGRCRCTSPAAKTSGASGYRPVQPGGRTPTATRTRSAVTRVPSSSSARPLPRAVTPAAEPQLDAGVLVQRAAGGGRRPGPSARRTARGRRRSASRRPRARPPRTPPPGRSGRRRRSAMWRAARSAASSASASSSVRSACACGSAGERPGAAPVATSSRSYGTARRVEVDAVARGRRPRCRAQLDAVLGVPGSRAQREIRPLAREDRLGERRAVVGRVRLGADHGDRAVVAVGAQRLGAALGGEARRRRGRSSCVGSLQRARAARRLLAQAGDEQRRGRRWRSRA